MTSSKRESFQIGDVRYFDFLLFLDLSLAALAYIVEHFLFKDELYRVAVHHYFVSYMFCYTLNYFNSQEDSYLFWNVKREIKRKHYIRLFFNDNESKCAKRNL